MTHLPDSTLRNVGSSLRALIGIGGILLGIAACQKNAIPESTGTLSLQFHVDESVTPVASAYTKMSPNPTSFSLTIKQGDQIIRNISPIGTTTPPEISLPVGDYSLEVFSREFTVPTFNFPVYSASEAVNISAGVTRNVTLECRQSNAGIRISYDDAFQRAHTSYSARIEHASGALDFVGDDATLTGYFPAGNATLIVSADGTRFEQSLVLRSCRLYNILVKDETPGIMTGNTNVTITVTTDVEQENLTVTVPASGTGGGSSRTLYSENIGTTNVASQQLMQFYTGWQNGTQSGITYSGTGLITYGASESSQGYTGASGGNYLLLESGNSLLIEGLNTLGATRLLFSWGCCNHSLTAFNTSDLTLSVGTTGQQQDETPLTYSRTAASGWATATTTSSLPASATLSLRLQCNAGSYRIDDLTLTGVK